MVYWLRLWLAIVCREFKATSHCSVKSCIICTVVHQNDFFHCCVLCWNNLPSAATNATSLKLFKNVPAKVDLTNHLQYRFWFCFIFFYVFILRRHVSGVFMSHDCHAVRDFITLVSARVVTTDSANSDVSGGPWTPTRWWHSFTPLCIHGLTTATLFLLVHQGQ